MCVCVCVYNQGLGKKNVSTLPCTELPALKRI